MLREAEPTLVLLNHPPLERLVISLNTIDKQNSVFVSDEALSFFFKLLGISIIPISQVSVYQHSIGERSTLRKTLSMLALKYTGDKSKPGLAGEAATTAMITQLQYKDVYLTPTGSAALNLPWRTGVSWILRTAEKNELDFNIALAYIPHSFLQKHSYVFLGHWRELVEKARVSLEDHPRSIATKLQNYYMLQGPPSHNDSPW